MASFQLNRTGTSTSAVTAIRVREQSESSTVNRYVSGSIGGLIVFNSIADGVSHTYVVEVDFQDCSTLQKTFPLIEPCKGTPSLVTTDDCSVQTGANANVKITVGLQNSSTVRIRVLNGTTVLKNEVVNSGTTVTYSLPKNVSLKIIAEHPTLGTCKNESTHVITCDCSFTVAASNPRSETGGNPEPVAPGYFSASTFNAKNLNPWAAYGNYQNTYKPGASVFDFIGGFRAAPWVYNGSTDKLSNLGVQKVGIYLRGDYADQGVPFGDNSQYLARENNRLNRYLYLQQSEYEQTNPEMLEPFKDPNPSIDGAPYTFDSGEVWYPDIYDITNYQIWSIIRAWHTRSTPVSAGNTWGIVRFNVEGHVDTGDFNWYRKARNVHRGGMYRHSRNGGNNTNQLTGETRLPGEPNYAQMSDLDFWLYVRQCQVNYSQWVYEVSQSQNVDVIGYDLESKAGFIQELASPGAQWNDTRGYRKETNWKLPSQLNNKSLRETMYASNQGFLDVLFKAAPFQLVYTDVNREEQFNQQWPQVSYGIAERTAPTSVFTDGEPEFYRFVVDRNANQCPSRSSVQIRFEDKNGNLRRTTRKMATESATDDYRFPGGTSTSHDIPIGTSVFSYCHHVALGERWTTNTLDYFADERLLKDWEYVNYNYIADNKKPVQYQVYAKTLNDRNYNANNEVTDSGQLPKTLVFGLKILGQVFNVMHVWYNAFTYTGALTLDNVFAAEKFINPYQDHFVENQVSWVPIEVSLDNGVTWTSANPIIRRTDIVAGEGDAFYANDPMGYNSTWVTNRRTQGKASPFTFVTFNSTTNSYVIFEKVAFGDIMTYSFRVKESNGQYRYFNDRVSTNDWKATRLNLIN